MLRIKARSAFVVYGVLLVAISPLLVAGTDEEPHTELIEVITREQALREDAQTYAAEFKVSVAEAEARLRAQAASTSLREEFATLAGGRFAGTWIEHRPEFRIVLSLTDSEPLAGLDRIAEDSRAGGYAEVRYGAVYSYDRLVAALERISGIIHKYPSAGIGLNLRQNSVVVRMSEQFTAAERAAIGEAAQGPVAFVEALGVRAVTDHTRGGRSLTPVGCTTGFTAITDSGVRGVLTAGHCAAFVGQLLTYHQNADVNYDLRVYYKYADQDEDWAYLKQPPSDPQHVVETIFWSGTNYRTVTDGDAPGQVAMEGDYVCHFGRGSAIAGIGEDPGRTCGLVEDASYAPPAPICGPESNLWCAPEFAYVESGAGSWLYCTNQDSGGPWFANTRAYGIHFGRAHNEDGTLKGCFFTRTQKVDNRPFDIMED